MKAAVLGGVLALEALVALVAFGVTIAGVSMFRIPSVAMKGTLQVGETVVLERGDDVRRGDIVAIEAPEWRERKNGLFLLRVIGVGGDRISVGANGQVAVNGKPLRESYLGRSAGLPGARLDVTVPPGRLWLMGDHRGAAVDSVQHQRMSSNGTVDARGVQGHVIAAGSGADWHGVTTPDAFVEAGLAERRGGPPAPLVTILVGTLAALALPFTVLVAVAAHVRDRRRSAAR